MAIHDRKRTLIAVVLVLTAGSLLYRALYAGGLEQTSALFIGLPAFLAILLVSVARPRSAMGLALMATTLALLLSGIVLGEGFVCILMASPIFYLVTILVVWLDAWAKRRRDKLRVLALLPLALLALEGVVPGYDFGREESVTVEMTLPISLEALEGRLARPPSFSAPLPWALRPGFPRPVSASGDGLEIGHRRRIVFAAGDETSLLEFEVTERGAHRLMMTLITDETPIAHWLTWRLAEIEWYAAPAGTAVRLTLAYRRELDPAFYFGPLERTVVRIAGEYLLESLVAEDAVARG